MAKKKTITRKKAQVVAKGKKIIRSKETYDITIKEIDALMKKGEKNLSEKEMERLGALAEAAEAFEDKHDPLPLPDSLPEIIRMRMYQMQLTQSFVAKLLGVSDTKFSLIMNGKQKPDIYFIKAIHEKLKMDANQILKAL
jgi:HTH-type transcriptional regulator/antitoxin HigA